MARPLGKEGEDLRLKPGLQAHLRQKQFNSIVLSGRKSHSQMTQCIALNRSKPGYQPVKLSQPLIGIIYYLKTNPFFIENTA